MSSDTPTSTLPYHRSAGRPPGIDDATLREWYRVLHLGRMLDEKAARYLKMSKGWSYHAPCAGHEGIQLAMGLTVRRGVDFLFPYYRDLLTVLAAGLTPEEIILNGLSRATDVAGGGRHMSNHFAKPALRIQNVSSCVGSHSLHAAGVARAARKFGGEEIAWYSSGESATSEGYFYEALAGACREKLPVIFVLQNNGYAISVPVHEQSANTNIAQNFRGFRNLLVLDCDGTNVFDAWNAIQLAPANALPDIKQTARQTCAPFLPLFQGDKMKLSKTQAYGHVEFDERDYIDTIINRLSVFLDSVQ